MAAPALPADGFIREVVGGDQKLAFCVSRGTGADRPPRIYTGMRHEAKGGDGAAYVIASRQVRVWASDGNGVYNHSIPNNPFRDG